MPKRRKSPVKKIKYKPQSKRNTFRSFLFAIFVVALSTLALLGFIAFKAFNAPFSNASLSSNIKSDFLSDSKRVNIIAVKVSKINDPTATINDLYLLAIDRENKSYTTYKIPVDNQIDYFGNYGKGTLANVFSTGNKDELRGMYLLQKTILKNFAVPVDGFVMVDDGGYKMLTNQIGELDKNDLSVSLRLKNLPSIPKAIIQFRDLTVTNLRIKDITELLFFFRSTPKSSANYVELSTENVLKPSTFDKIWQKNQKISDIKKEGIKVFIVNASNPKIPGLALWGQRVVENLGLDVLETENSDKSYSENTLLADNFELQTVNALKKTLDIKELKLISDLKQKDGYNPQVFRTKVSLILTSN